MISSEVQRTLVKSPPELWAELSDPAALARHLGELGEIRITRIEPEQLVEWEAENRTGTVQIKPSGWGTRVTLTVATEVPETGAIPDPTPQVAAQPMTADDEALPPAHEALPTADEVLPAADEVLPTADEVLPTADEALPPAHEALPAAHEALPTADQALPTTAEAMTTADECPEPPAAYLPPAHAEDEPAGYFESVPSPLGAPLTAAAASSWRADLQTEPVEAPSAERAVDDAGLAAEATDREEPGEAYEWEPDEDTEVRRGFFTRFFGRWRRATDRWAQTADAPLEAMDSPLEADPPLEADAALENDPPLEADTALEDESALEANPELEADAALEDGHAVEGPAGEPPMDGPSTNEIEAHIDGAAGKGIAEDGEAEPEQAGDIASELKAAEEVTDAEVTAVLTSVLDRLGAAHHRPFSRS